METKKNKAVDHSRHRPLFLGIGLFISIICIFLVFEAQAKYVPAPLPYTPDEFADWIPVIPPTVFPKKKTPIKPKPVNKDFIISTEPIDEVIEEIVKEIIKTKETDESTINWADTTDIDIYTGASTGIEVVEEEATFPGGAAAWMKFLRRNFKYPRLAKRAGIEGKVFLSFYVDDEGIISDIKVIRGIGGGCDEEAIRVLKRSPKWNPGRQRGRPVKSPMTLFINFVLK